MDIKEISSLFFERKLDEALAALNERLASTPDCLDSLRYRASIYEIKGRYSEALSDISRVMNSVDELQLQDYFSFANISLALEHYASAEESLRRLIDLGAARDDPWFDEPARLLLAVTLFRMDRLDEAKEICRALPNDLIVPDRKRLWQPKDILDYQPGMVLSNACPVFPTEPNNDDRKRRSRPAIKVNNPIKWG
jgi:tetratricopeptide (TPR) repeat protein